MKVVFFGTPSFVIPVLSCLLENFDVVGVVSTPDEKIGRKQLITPSPVKTFYQEYINKEKKTGSILTPKTLDEKSIEEQLKVLQPDFFVVAAYGKIIPQSILDIPTHGAVNIHPSLLPQYRGPSPIQTAILNGDTQTGTTLILMDEEIDHGPILLQKPYPIASSDTFDTLAIKLFQLSAELLPTTMQQWSNKTISPIPQNHDKATFTNHITKQDGHFDSENPPLPEKLDRMIRAYYPWPNAWTRVRIKNSELRVKLLPQKMIQVEGGKPMSNKDLLNGYPELKETLERLKIED